MKNLHLGLCDTFYPLKLTKFAKKFDDGKYACSWYENAQELDQAPSFRPPARPAA